MPVAPEHIPTVERVNAYLAPRVQGDVCRDVLDCNSWSAEDLLLTDLRQHIEGTSPLPSASRAETRLYLRAVSWFLYPALSDQALLEKIDGLAMLSADDRALFHGALAHVHEEEAIEAATQRIEILYLAAWDKLEAARHEAPGLPWRELIRNDLPGSVQQAKQAVDDIRPIRDALYFRRHLGHWLTWSGTNTGKSETTI